MDYGVTIRQIGQALLERHIVSQVLAFTHGLDGKDVMPSLITSPEELARITIVSRQPLSLAKVISRYVDPAVRLAVVVRPCDARAIIELAKRNQLDRDNYYLIGITCYGTIDKAEGLTSEVYVFPDHIEANGENYDLNESLLLPHCRRCGFAFPDMADVTYDFAGGHLKANTPRGQEMLSISGLVEQGQKIDTTALEERTKRWRTNDFAIAGSSPQTRLDYWLHQFDKCIKCYGCRNSCPLCYCKDCYLDADRGLVEPGKIPPSLLFHLTRIIHVADSCLNCGQCEMACPSDIPLSRLSQELQLDLGSIFDYTPGTDIISPPPLDTLGTKEGNK